MKMTLTKNNAVFVQGYRREFLIFKGELKIKQDFYQSWYSAKLRTKQDFPRTGAQLKIAPVLNKL